MPSGHTPTAANRQPVNVGDATSLDSINFTTDGPGTTNPSLRKFIPRVISPGGVATTLVAADSGALCLWDNAAGFTFTLPAPVVGLRFTFAVSTTNTSSNHKVITNAGTVFLRGSLLQAIEDTAPGTTAGPKDFLLNGTTHVAITMNGTTTGGIIGTWIDMLCISSTLWLVSGYVKGSGTIATPAATS